MELLKSSSKFSKKQIFLLSIPVFFSNIAIPLVGMVDTGLMGNLGETKYLAATSVATSVMTMIIWSFGFLRMGTVGIVSQAFGRGDYREIVKTLLRNFIIAIIIAFFIIEKELRLLNTSGNKVRTSILINLSFSSKLRWQFLIFPLSHSLLQLYHQVFLMIGIQISLKTY